MKKFGICLFIIAVFGAYVFYLGWTQIKVKPDSIGIVVSKLDGVNKTPVVPGKFSWHKEFLLPTNAELIKLNINPVITEKHTQGELPSAGIYSSLLGNSTNFNYSFTYSIGLTIYEEDVVELFEQNKIRTQDDLDKYLQASADAIAQLCTEYILTKAQDNPNFRPESIRREDLTKGIMFYKECPNVELSVFAITQVELPDYSLYKKLQNQILSSNTFNLTNTITNDTSAVKESANADENTDEELKAEE